MRFMYLVRYPPRVSRSTACAPVLSFVLLTASIAPAAAQQCMYTIAGGGSQGFSRDDGGAAIAAPLSFPFGVALYRDGYLIADQANHLIRWVNATSGTISTVAGTRGSAGYSGDGGPATNASLYNPSGVAPYGGGGFIIADSSNNAIRFVSGNGIMSTIAGNGSQGYSGDGGPATAARLNLPFSVAINGSDTFIGDTNNFRIRRVSGNGLGIISTVAGSGAQGNAGDGGAATAATIRRVYGIAVYSGGLLIADWDNACVRRVDGSGIISTVAGGGISSESGPATSVALSGPQGIGSSGGSEFYIVDTGNVRIRLVNATGFISTVAGSTTGNSGDGGAATAAQMNTPTGVASDAFGGLLIADQYNLAIRYVTPPGMCRPLVNCSVAAPNLVCTFSPVAPYLYLNVTLSGAACALLQAAPATLRNVSCPLPNAATGNLMWTLGKSSSSMSVVNTAYIPPPTCMYTIAGGNGQGFSGDGAGATAAALKYPYSVALYRDGYLIADRANNVIRFVNATSGVISTVAGTPLSQGFSGDGSPATSATLRDPRGLAAFAGGFVIADTFNNAIRFVNGSTNLISTIAGRGVNSPGDGAQATNALLITPFAISVNGSEFIIADTNNFRIRRVDGNRTITTIAGTGSNGNGADGVAATSSMINSVYGIAVYAGGLLMADWAGRIRRVDGRGNISTVAGGGNNTSSGPATSAKLFGPQGVASDGASVFMISDTDSHTIRVVDASGFISTVAGNGSQGYSGDGNVASSAQMDTPTAAALDSSGGVLVADNYNHAIRYVTPPGMCRPTVNCSVFAPNLVCTFSPVAPYLFVNASLSGAACALLQSAPAVTRNVSCPLPNAATGVLTWTVGKSVSSMMIVNAAYVPPPPPCMFTIAGGNAAGYAGDGGAATAARLDTPYSIALYRGGYLISDRASHAIRWVNISSGAITTVAGNGTASCSGDGGPAIIATLNEPFGVAIYAGGFLVADRSNNIVRFVNGSSSVISTVAGVAEAQGFSGEGVQATSAVMSGPTAIAVNGSDFVVADMWNFRIRRVSASGIITTIVGTGAKGYSGDGGAATAARIGWVYGIAIHSGWLLIADSDYDVIRRMDGSGTMATVAGGGTVIGSGPATLARLDSPFGVTVASASTFLIADTKNHLIASVDSFSALSTIAGSSLGYSGDSGPATAAKMFAPTSVALDGFGGFLVTDANNRAIRYVTPSGMCRPLVNCSVVDSTVICTFSPVAPYLYLDVSLSGAACTLLHSAPAVTRNVTCPLPNAATGTLTWTLGNVANSMSIVNTAYVPPPPSCMYTIAGGSNGYAGDGDAATRARLDKPWGVALHSDGFVITDRYNHVARLVNITSGIITTIAGNGSSWFSGDAGPATQATMRSPAGIATYADGILLADWGNNAVRFINGSTRIISTLAGRGSSLLREGGQATSAALSNPLAIAVNGSDILVADTLNYLVRRINASGMVNTIAGNGTRGYSGDGFAASSATIGRVYGIALYTGRLLMADIDFNVVRCVDTRGIITTISGGGASTVSGPATSVALNAPQGVADGSSSFFIADTDNNLIRAVDAAGIMYTVAGSVAGYSGDGGPATEARLARPVGIAPDGLGGFLIADNNNDAIRYVTPPGMCQPLVICRVAAPSVRCTFSSVAPYLFLNASFSGAACTLLQAAPAVTRIVSCPLPSAAAGALTWTLGTTQGSLNVPIPSQTPTSTSLGSRTTTSTLSVSTSRSGAATPSSTQAEVLSSTGSASSIPSFTTSSDASSASTATSPTTRDASSVTAIPTGSSPVPTASASRFAVTLSPSTSPSTITFASSSRSTTSSRSPSASTWASTPAPAGAPVLSLFLTSPLTVLTSSIPQLQLRDVDPPLLLLARASSCPASASCRLTCSTSNTDTLRVHPSSSPISDISDASIALWAPYAAASAPSAALLLCSVSRLGDAVSSSRVSISVTITPLPLPLLTDVLVHIPRQPLARSVWSSTPCNITAAVASNASQLLLTMPAASPSLLFAPASPVTQAYDTALLTFCATQQSAPRTVYQLTSTGGSNITLVTNRAFATLSKVRIGQLPTAALRVSLDIKLMHIQLPSSLALCGSYECGYVPLTLDTGVVNVTCPGFCATSNGTIPQCGASCSAAAIGDGWSPPTLLDPSPLSGLFITSTCTSDAYTDPSTGACLNSSDPASARCAFGAGDDCSPCPAHALCPGGFRAWPLPGYFTPLETTGAIEPCPLPASRCSGWSALQSVVSCAVGYRDRSYLCSACAVGFFADIDGSCVACPSRPSPGEFVLPFAIFVGYIVAALVGMYLLMLGIATAVKSRTSDIHSRMTGLAAWSFITVQLVAQAGRTAATGLPSTLLSMYNALSVSQFAGITLPSPCINGYPFTSEVSSMTIGLSTLVLAACLCIRMRKGNPSRVLALALRACVLTLTLVYPTLVNSAMSIVTCNSVRISVLTYMSLDGDGGALTRAGVSLAETPASARGTLIDVPVQSSSPSRVCYEGDHTPAAALAWVALTLVGIVYPLLSMWCVHLRLRSHLTAQAAPVHREQKAEGETEDPFHLHRAEHRHSKTLNSYQPSVALRVHMRRISTSGMSTIAQSIEAQRPKRLLHKSVPTTERASGRRAGPQEKTASIAGDTLSAPVGLRSRFACSRGADDCAALLHDGMLTPFVRGDYRPSVFAFYAVDRYVILCLSIIAATLPSTTDASVIAARASLLLLVLLTNATLVLVFAPFHPHEWWKAAVKLLTIALTCAITALNAMTNVMTIRASSAGVPLSDTSSAAITGGAYVVFALCLCVLAALPLTFMLNAIRPPAVLTPSGSQSQTNSSATSHTTTRVRVNPLTVISSGLIPPLRRGSASSSAPNHHSAHALSFAASSLAHSPARVTGSPHAKRVLRTSTVALATAVSGEGYNRSRRRSTRESLAEYDESLRLNLASPGMSTFARAATRRRSGIAR